MSDQNRHLEIVWDNLLSRNPQKIGDAFVALDRQSQETIREHLQKMTTEEGWHPGQTKSAVYALQTIRDL
jgi:hypothetical protein